MNRRQFFKLTAAASAVALVPIAAIEETVLVINPPPPSKIIDRGLWFVDAVCVTMGAGKLRPVKVNMTRYERVFREPVRFYDYDQGYCKKYLHLTGIKKDLEIDFLADGRSANLWMDLLRLANAEICIEVGLDDCGKIALFSDGEKIEGVRSVLLSVDYDWRHYEVPTQRQIKSMSGL